MSNKQFTVKMKIDRTTSNTFRFQEQDEAGRQKDKSDTLIGQQYIQKRAFDGDAPETVTVTVQW